MMIRLPLEVPFWKVGRVNSECGRATALSEVILHVLPRHLPVQQREPVVSCWKNTPSTNPFVNFNGRHSPRRNPLSEQHSPTIPRHHFFSSYGAPVPDEPRNNFRPSGNVTSLPFARFEPSFD